LAPDAKGTGTDCVWYAVYDVVYGVGSFTRVSLSLHKMIDLKAARGLSFTATSCPLAELS